MVRAHLSSVVLGLHSHMYAKMIPSGMLLPWDPPLISFAFMPKTDEMNDNGNFAFVSRIQQILKSSKA